MTAPTLAHVWCGACNAYHVAPATEEIRALARTPVRSVAEARVFVAMTRPPCPRDSIRGAFDACDEWIAEKLARMVAGD